jgi:hypothetical protein
MGSGTLVALVTGAASWRALAHEGHDHGPAATPGTPAATPGATPGATPIAGHDHAHGTNPAAGTGVGGLYLTIANAGPEPDALLGGVTDVCRVVEPHTMQVTDDVASMTFAGAGLPVAADASLELTPEGDHVMLVDLTRDLQPGTTYDITLRFAVAGEVTLTVPVRWDDPSAAGDAATAVTTGALTISNVWTRPAPMIGG